MKRCPISESFHFEIIIGRKVVKGENAEFYVRQNTFFFFSKWLNIEFLLTAYPSSFFTPFKVQRNSTSQIQHFESQNPEPVAQVKKHQVQWITLEGEHRHTPETDSKPLFGYRHRRVCVYWVVKESHLWRGKGVEICFACSRSKLFKPIRCGF